MTLIHTYRPGHKPRVLGESKTDRAGRWAAYIAFIILAGTLVFLGGYQAGVWG